MTIRNLVLDDWDLPVDAVKAEGYADWAHHITLENLLKGNFTATLEGAADYLDQPLASLGEMSLYPKPGKLLSGPFDTASLPIFIDSDRDFNEQPRVARFLGAYAGQGLNPGWFPGFERKPGMAGD